MLRYAEIDPRAARTLLAQHGLDLIDIGAGEPIPGSFWGVPEAGVIGARVYVRADTPVHSLLHEACHLVVMPAARRNARWADWVAARMAQPGTVFVAVGAGHLAGKGSVQTLLAEKGLKAERVSY